jgi:uncharacterized protein
MTAAEQGEQQGETSGGEVELRRRGWRGPVAGTEAARRGGLALREKYGPAFFARIGTKGGERVRDQRGPAFYAQFGQLGGTSTRERHGLEFYTRIGRQGGLRRGKGRRKPADAGPGPAGR